MHHLNEKTVEDFRGFHARGSVRERVNSSGKRLFLIVLACFPLLISSGVIADEWVQINSEDFLDAESLEIDTADSTLRFDIAKPSGGQLTSYELDFASGTWGAVEIDGSSYGGFLPPDASTEIWIPCISNPLSMGLCAVGLIFSATVCEMRDHNAHRRAVTACAHFGGVDSFYAGQCGLNSSYVCRDFVQTQ